MKKVLFLVAVVAIGGFSCSNKKTKYLPYDEQLAIDSKSIADYLGANGINARFTTEGLWYKITKKGDGDFPVTGSNVIVNYTCKLLDGTVIDSNTSSSFSFTLGKGSVIKGLDMGLQLIRIGGKASLFVPSGLAYGTNGQGKSIEPNEILIFDIELVDFK